MHCILCTVSCELYTAGVGLIFCEEILVCLNCLSTTTKYNVVPACLLNTHALPPEECVLSHEALLQLKLDGVGPVDNRPSTDKLYQIV